MKRMINISSIFFVALSIFLFLPFELFAENSKNKDIVKKIEDLVVKVGDRKDFDSQFEGAGTSHIVVFCAENKKYHVEVRTFKDGSSDSLDLSCYELSKIIDQSSGTKDNSKPDDIVGKSEKILVERHVYDTNVDGCVDICKEFKCPDKDGYSFVGFTKEERDRGYVLSLSGEKFYVKRTDYVRGQFLEGEKWRVATDPEINEIGRIYKEILDVISKRY